VSRIRLILLAVSLLFAVTPAPTIKEENKCDRIRRPVHQMSVNELMLYVDGIQAIRENGKYQIMVDAHSQYTEVHRGSSFFFYHTYFVWEVETQIRKLGDKWKCFALPYYDWTVEAGNEADPWILNTVFGGDGVPGNNNCVADPKGYRLWGIDKWPVRELCGPPEDVEEGCCLKRSVDKTQRLSTPKDLAPVIEVPFFHEFLGGVLIEHQKVHWLFGQQGDQCKSCHMATGYSPDDPLFMMLHSMVAYLRALWAGCHGYDNIDSFILDNHPDVYTGECIDGFDECGAIELDEAYSFGPMEQADWSLTHKQSITPREMWSFKAWRVKYDHGTFYEMSGLKESDMCDPDNVAKSEWFAHPDEIQTVKEKMQAIWGMEEPEPENPLPSPPPPKKDDVKPNPSGTNDKPPPKEGDKPPPKKPKQKAQAKLNHKAEENLSVFQDVETVERNNRYQMIILASAVLFIMVLYIWYENVRRKRDGNRRSTKQELRDQMYGSIELQCE